MKTRMGTANRTATDASNLQAALQHCTSPFRSISMRLHSSRRLPVVSVFIANRLGPQGEITKDPIYVDAERRFAELEKETKRLHDESKK